MTKMVIFANPAIKGIVLTVDINKWVPAYCSQHKYI